MLINEIVSPLPLFHALVRAKAANMTLTLKTAIHAEGPTQARQLLTAIYGEGSVQSITQGMTEGTKTLSPQELQVKSLADKSKQFAQQAKRYTNTVDVSAVRDLYGAIINEGATKGILVTTSHYGPDAYGFAKDKPITLLNGGELLGLLQKYGYDFKIDLAEAKRLNAESNNQ